jgi:hypothetical protein
MAREDAHNIQPSTSLVQRRSLPSPGDRAWRAHVRIAMRGGERREVAQQHFRHA